MQVNAMNTKCANTPACWSCSAPVRIEFVRGADISRFSRAPGLVYEGNTLFVARGMIRQGYKTDHVSVFPFSPSIRPFRIEHRSIIKVTDANHDTIWENSAC